MELPFYAERLRGKFGMEVLVPDERGRDDVHRIIYDELCHGIVSPESRATYVTIIEELARRGAQAVILGCTEITLLIGADDSPLPVFDTTALHRRRRSSGRRADRCRAENKTRHGAGFLSTSAHRSLALHIVWCAWLRGRI